MIQLKSLYVLVLVGVSGCHFGDAGRWKVERETVVDFSRYAPDVAAGDWCFVMLDVRTGEVIRHNPARCQLRFSPCSTFKIPHAMFALEAGVLADEHEVLPWDGVERERAALNRDHDLRSATEHSVVWFFQEVAKRLGEAREQALLDRVAYGNRDISAGLTEFWLGTSLRVSADEQVRFLDRLRRGDLPCGARAQAIAADCIVQRREPGLVYHGKTGSDRGEQPGTDLGWWVGWVERGDGAFVFAANMSGHRTFGPQVRATVERILADRRILPPALQAASAAWKSAKMGKCKSGKVRK